MLRIRTAYSALVIVMALLVGCGGNSSDLENVEYDYQVPEQIDDDWTTADITSKGVDVTGIEEMIKSIKSGHSADIHSVIVVLDGDLVLEEYFPGIKFSWFRRRVKIPTDFNRNTLHYNASTTKSFASALVGLCVDQGLINDVEESLYSFFPAYAGLSNPRKSEITLRQALTMTDGLAWYEDHDYIDMVGCNDWYERVLGKTVSSEPDTIYRYHSGMSTLLGGVVQNAYGDSAVTFADEFFFGPLGIESYRWGVGYHPTWGALEHFLGPNGELPTGSGLWLTPRDMAKFGQLLLDKGIWNGERIISEEWIDESTAKVIDFFDGTISAHISGMYYFDPGFYPQLTGYGYQWWWMAFNVDGEIYEAYMSSGHGGQHIVVFDQLDMVVVVTGGNYDGNQHRIIRKTGLLYLNDVILPAVLNRE